ncbi:MAG: cupin domain-containing protein [Desulfovibrio sp.]|nr:MAG: cupin domain-containing protein [Desulfovibrio sp.]
MIVKAGDAKRGSFLGTTFDVLAVGEKTMLTRMQFRKGRDVPPHSHPHEQTGFVLSGRFRFRFGEFDEVLEVGDSYSIPGNVEHSIEMLENGEVLDLFSPPREDYL